MLERWLAGGVLVAGVLLFAAFWSAAAVPPDQVPTPFPAESPAPPPGTPAPPAETAPSAPPAKTAPLVWKSAPADHDHGKTRAHGDDHQD